ncbi:MAG: type II toxin-antitoxin system VapC family toxin [Terriglobales bacterium]
MRHRLERAGTLAPQTANAALAHLRARLERHWLRQPLNEAAFDLAAVFIDRHPLRAPDALQLAACMALQQNQPVQFICSDQRLLAAARAEGIPCWDPAAALE